MTKIIWLFLFSTTVLAAEQNDIAVELEEIIVKTSALHETISTVKPTIVLSGEKLRRKISHNLGDTLKNELGVTSQTFGAGVGTPVIRGQAGARVRVMQNGLGNNDVSTLSPDHANSVEPILAERIEVLRGPATLLYGSGMIGGVVNVIDNRIPQTLPNKLFGGAAEQRFDSASNETASVVKLEGGQQNLAYHLDGFYRSHGNLRIGGNAIAENAARATDPTLADVASLENSNGMIQNTGGWSRGGSAGVSYIRDKSFIGAAINQLENNYGIPSDGSGSEPIRIAMQQTKYDLKAQLDKPFSGINALKYKLGYTDYQHTEMDNGIPATRFLNESFENRLEIDHQIISGLKGTWGIQTTNSQFAALGNEAIVPRSAIANYAGFFMESLDLGDFNYELSARIENQTIHPEQSSSFSYLPLSGAASIIWKMTPQQQLSFAITHSERAPLVQELLSHGIHEATRSYELGNSHLTKELSNNFDLRYRYHAQRFSAEINLFQNWVNRYIYQQRTGEVFNTDLESIENRCSTNSSACLPIELSQQRNAIFRGFETKIELPLMKNHFGQMDFTLFADYTRGFFADGGNVPRMPPLRYGFEFDYAYQNFSSNLRLTRANTQQHSAMNESVTPGYLLFNLGAQYTIAHVYQTKMLFFANGKNLLNENIRNATSYLRNFSPEAGRAVELGIRISY